MKSRASLLPRLVLGAAALLLPAAARGQSAAPQPVTLRVLLPQADAQLLVEDLPTRQTGPERVFFSPPLDVAKEYVYTLTAVWAPNNYTTITRTRQFPVRAGQVHDADLRRPDDRSPDRIVVRYVPTPHEVVEAMLKLAGVGKGDVVYDLGCGDGRLVLTAVARHGARRGVGVDIDPELVKVCRDNARQARVEDRVEFRVQDVLEIKDLGEASVVLLYMGEDLNLRLRPILQRTLKPGSRVVSHRFTMGDWRPERTVRVTDAMGERYDLHLWTIGGGKP